MSEEFTGEIPLTDEDRAEIDELKRRDDAEESIQISALAIADALAAGCHLATADAVTHKFISNGVLPDQLPGERIDLTIRQLIRSMQQNFLEIGGLLCDLYDGKLWFQAGFDRWKDYVESLGIGSYTFVQSLMGIARIVAQNILTSGDIAEIGYSKSCLLVPLANGGKLTEDIVALARVSTNRDLRLAIGYRVIENDSDSEINCPHCGGKIRGAAWKRKEE